MIPTAPVARRSNPRWPCPKIRFAWFPVWLRNKEDFRAVAMRNIEHIYDVRPRYAVVSLRHIHSILVAPSVRALEHCRARERVQKPPARIGRYERRARVGKARCEFRKF